MATKKYIKKIMLPGQTEAYSIYDEEAIHSIEELGLGSALVFKGTKGTVAEVETADNKVAVNFTLPSESSSGTGG